MSILNERQTSCPHCGRLAPFHAIDCEYERFKPQPADPQRPSVKETTERSELLAIIRDWWEWQAGVQELPPDDLSDRTCAVLGSPETPQECTLAADSPRCTTHDTPTDWVECTGWRCPTSGKIVTKAEPDPPAVPPQEDAAPPVDLMNQAWHLMDRIYRKVCEMTPGQAQPTTAFYDFGVPIIADALKPPPFLAAPDGKLLQLIGDFIAKAEKYRIHSELLFESDPIDITVDMLDARNALLAALDPLAAAPSQTAEPPQENR